MAGPGSPRRGSYLTEEEKKNSPKITKELIARVFSYLKPYWKQLLLVVACIVVSSVCSLFPSILTGNIIDVLTGKDLGGWFGAGLSAGSPSISPLICGTRCTGTCRRCPSVSSPRPTRATSSPG